MTLPRPDFTRSDACILSNTGNGLVAIARYTYFIRTSQASGSRSLTTEAISLSVILLKTLSTTAAFLSYVIYDLVSGRIRYKMERQDESINSKYQTI